MEAIETKNGWYITGTSSILRAQAFLQQERISGPLLFAQVGSREGDPWVWLSDRPGAPDAMPEA